MRVEVNSTEPHLPVFSCFLAVWHSRSLLLQTMIFVQDRKKKLSVCSSVEKRRLHHENTRNEEVKARWKNADRGIGKRNRGDVGMRVMEKRDNALKR